MTKENPIRDWNTEVDQLTESINKLRIAFLMEKRKDPLKSSNLIEENINKLSKNQQSLRNLINPDLIQEMEIDNNRTYIKELNIYYGTN